MEILGYCPMGCGRSLTLGEAGAVVCAGPGCPRPDAVTEILRDSETEHVAVITDEGFTLRHPLRERLGDALMSCSLHEYLQDPALPVAPGRYRVSGDGSWPFLWTFGPRMD
jgi:hypothetical protein